MQKSGSIIAFIFVLFSGFLTFGQSLQWLKTGGALGNDYGNRTRSDKQGNVYISGNFSGSFSIGGTSVVSSGLEDIYLAKFSSSGSLIWIRTGGGPDNDWSYDLYISENGNIYITGHFLDTAHFGISSIISKGSVDAFVAKYDSSGNLIWIKSGGGVNDDIGRAVAVDSSENVYLAGTYDNNVTFGNFTDTTNNMFDIFITKFDATGTPLWLKTITTTADDWVSDIAVKNGNLIIVGHSYGNLLIEGQQFTNSGVNISPDWFLVKYTTNGNFVWAKVFGDSNADFAESVFAHPNGNISVLGWYQGKCVIGNDTLSSAGSVDIYLAKFDGLGNAIKAKSYGGINDDRAFDLNIDEKGNALVAGWFWGNFGSLTSNGMWDALFMCTDSLFNIKWLKKGGGTGQDFARGACWAPNGSVYFSGNFKLNSDFGGALAQSQGNYDFFLVKYSDVTNINTKSSGVITTVWPNPAFNQLNIKVSENRIIQLSMFTTDGKRILNYNQPIPDIINLDKLAPGFYQLVIELEKGIIENHKIIVK